MRSLIEKIYKRVRKSIFRVESQQVKSVAWYGNMYGGFYLDDYWLSKKKTVTVFDF